jgi:alkylation response protein AidB-like acyl-CoA dehydrogenase
VPVANRIGEENKGWTYAKYLLEFERGNAYAPGLCTCSQGQEDRRGWSAPTTAAR